MKAFLVSAFVTLTLGQTCRDFSYDLCDFNENAIIWSGNTLSSQECQNKCKELDQNGLNCQIFQFNLQNGYCYALNHTLQGDNYKWDDT